MKILLEVFSAGSSWFCGFKNCCTFHYVMLSGERAGVNEKGCKDTSLCYKAKQNNPKLIDIPYCIFNFDETSLY